MTKKKCDNVACPLKGHEIETDQKNCLGCDRELNSITEFSDLFDSFFGPGKYARGKDARGK